CFSVPSAVGRPQDPTSRWPPQATPPPQLRAPPPPAELSNIRCASGSPYWSSPARITRLKYGYQTVLDSSWSAALAPSILPITVPATFSVASLAQTLAPLQAAG